MTYTPGPWVWEEIKGDHLVTEWTLIGPSTLCRYWYDKPPNDDARLIAAAPDLVEALLGLQHTLDGMSDYDGQQIPGANEAWEKAGQALNKALGHD